MGPALLMALQEQAETGKRGFPGNTPESTREHQRAPESTREHSRAPKMKYSVPNPIKTGTKPRPEKRITRIHFTGNGGDGAGQSKSRAAPQRRSGRRKPVDGRQETVDRGATVPRV